MKFISLCVIVFLMSCGNVQKPVNEVVQPSNDLVGSWSMCSVSDGKNLIQLNVCTEIILMHDGKGIVANNGIVTEKFQWSLERVQLKIFYPKTVFEPTFSDTSYFVALSKDSSTMNLTLRHNESVFYLSKYIKP